MAADSRVACRSRQSGGNPAARPGRRRSRTGENPSKHPFGGGLDGTPGNVFYLPPDTLEWEDCELGYTDFLNWAFSGDLALFYENVRWMGWQKEAAALGGDSIYHFFPPLWTEESADIEQTSRRIVPITEHYAATLDILRQLAE